MSGVFSAAPAWSESTLQWIKENHPAYLGARGTANQKLKSALFKAGFLLAESRHDIKRQEAELRAAVEHWDSRKHFEFVQWMAAGGYKAPPPAPRHPPPIVYSVVNPDGTEEREEISLEMPEAEEEPKARPQSLEEVVAAVEFDGDDRYGAW